MAVRVYIPTPYRSFTGDQTHVEVEAASVAELLGSLGGRFPELKERILSEDGRVPGHLNVYVNQVETRTLQGEATPLKDGDEVALIPAMAGGALLSEEQMERYSRHTRLDEVGVEGQRRLLDSKVLLVGAGALASPVAVYLAAAGVGTIGIVDGDRVDVSNLQRQILHFTHDVGRPKVQSARRHIEDINPDVRVDTYPTFLSSENAFDILRGYDVVVNGSDNFPTRYLVNDACVLLGKPLVDASILKWEGQATVFLPGKGCYRCLFPSPPPPGTVPSCAEAGIIGALAGHLGSLQAVETVKILLGLGRPLSNRLILYDALSGDYQALRWNRNPQCPICGDQPTITQLVDYEGFCGIPLPGAEEPHARTPRLAPVIEIGRARGSDAGQPATSPGAAPATSGSGGAPDDAAAPGASGPSADGATPAAPGASGPSADGATPAATATPAAAGTPGAQGQAATPGAAVAPPVADDFEPPAGSRAVTPHQAAAMIRRGAALVDVREPWEFARVRIPGSQLVPLDEIGRRAADLDPTIQSVFVCRVGERSAHAVDVLRRAGFEKAFNLTGGLVNWINEELPVEGDGVPAR